MYLKKPQSHIVHSRKCTDTFANEHFKCMHQQVYTPSLRLVQLNGLELIRLQPSTFNQQGADFQVFIWTHNLLESELLELTATHFPEISLERYQQYKSKRLTERLSVDLLLYRLLGCTEPLAHAPSGRPYLPESNLELSVSHTGNTYAVSLSTQRHGLDIEKWGDQALRVTSKFLTVTEAALLSHPVWKSPSEAATTLWSAKEAAYKFFDIKGLQLKRDVALTIEKANTLLVELPANALQAQVVCSQGPGCVLTLCHPRPNDKKSVPLHS